MMNEGFVKRSPPLRKVGNLILPKVSTDTLKLLNPNADALILGSTTEEGGDIKVYRDASGNLQISVDADAASNAEALVVYGGVVCQNYLTVGQTTLNTVRDFYVNGAAEVSGSLIGFNLFTNAAGTLHVGANGIKERVDNQIIIPIDITVSGTDSIDHSINLRIDSNDIIVVQATGDGAGGITDKAIGLYGTTPATQAAAISDPAESTAANNAAIDSILAALRGIGLIATA